MIQIPIENITPYIETFEDGRKWYEERPRFIVAYPCLNPHWMISVFANLAYAPTRKDIQEVIERALKALDVKGTIRDLHLDDSYSGGDVFWYANLE